MPGLLERIVQTRYSAVNPNDERFWGGGGSMSASGVAVTPESALGYDAFFACVRIIAEDVATLSVDVLRKRQDGKGQDSIPHRLWWLMNIKANPKQSALEWREWMTRVAILYPEAISEIVPGAGGFLGDLVPIHPAHYKKVEHPDGRVVYRVKDPKRNNGREVELSPDQVFRLPSPLGLGLVQLAKDDIGSAQAANKSMASMWRNGRRGMWGLQHPKELSKAAQDRLKAQVDEVSGPENTGRVLLFEDGLTWVDIGIKPEDAQALQQMEFSVLKMARWTRMQPHKVAYMIKASYNSIEQQNIEHVGDTIRPWLERWESAVQCDLFLEAETQAGYFLKHNEKALLRGAALEQAQYLEILRRIGAVSANEVRSILEMNPRADPEGDEYWNKQPGTGSGESNEAGSRQTSRAESITLKASERIVSRERIAVANIARKHAADSEGFAAGVQEFYGGLVAIVNENLSISFEDAETYCNEKAAEVIADGVKVVEGWEARDVPRLAEMALGGAE